MSLFFLKSPLLSNSTHYDSSKKVNVESFVHGFSTKLSPTESHEDCLASKDLPEILANLGNNFTVKLLKQRHTANFHLLTSPAEKTADIEADALITTQPNVLIGIHTADCLPILIACPERRVVAAIHAGWRGLYGDIIERCVEFICEKMGAPRHSLKVALGPCIGAHQYEVSQDFYDTFTSKNIDNSQFFYQKQDEISDYSAKSPYHLKNSSAKYNFDLQGCAKHALLKLGLHLSNIDLITIDTFQNPAFFGSYRRILQEKAGDSPDIANSQASATAKHSENNIITPPPFRHKGQLSLIGLCDLTY